MSPGNRPSCRGILWVEKIFARIFSRAPWLKHRGTTNAQFYWVNSGAPYGNRTRVSAVKGRRPGPLDEGREKGDGRARRTYRGVCAVRQGSPVAARRGVIPPLSRTRHGSPRLLGRQRRALLQEDHRMLV